MNKPFARKDMDCQKLKILNTGRWGNADIFEYQHNGKKWAIKDFRPCPWLVRQTLGRLMVRRELKALKRLNGLQGIAEDSFQLDDFALCYLYIDGKTLKRAKQEKMPLTPDYFLNLENLVKQMHARNIAHLDIRNLKNILITSNGQPGIIDFQSSVLLDRVPGVLHRLLKNIDLSGVYKCWHKISPETMDKSRSDLLTAMNRKRRLWVLKGYPFSRKNDPNHHD